MNDLDYIFTEIYDINNRIYALETSHLTKEYTHMTKVLTYDLTVENGAITVTPPVDTTVSQFQEIVVKATVTGLEGIKKTVKLSISSPTFATGVEEAAPEDYEYTMHLMPSTSESETFEVHLNEFLGTSLIIGSINECPILFSIMDAASPVVEYLGDLEGSISLYKTNTDISFAPSDITSIFIKLAELEKRLVDVEE